MSINSIMGMFAKSPIKPLQQHIHEALSCAQMLIPFLEATYKKDWDTAAQKRAQLSDLEKSADKLKRELRMKLPRGLFMPVERSDMLELITQQDKIANRAKDISGRILGRHMVIPTEMQSDVTSYLKRCLDAIKHATKAIDELDELLETGFAGRELQIIENLINELAVIEHDTDKMQITLRHTLHGLEQNLNPVDVVFLYGIIEWIGELADLAERVGARLELMLAR